MSPVADMNDFRAARIFKVLLVSALLVLFVMYRTIFGASQYSEIVEVTGEASRSEPAAKMQSSGNEENFEVLRQSPLSTVHIPDHLPFLQDFQSNVVVFPWINDSYCQHYEVRLGVNITPVYLVSFPRCGNTWTRYLVESATGIFSGSVYYDKSLVKLGYLGEMEKPTSKRILLIKDHLFKKKQLEDNSPVILILRNPKDAIASYLVFSSAALSNREDKHTFQGSASALHDAQKRIHTWIVFWEEVATTALKQPTLLVLLYEELKADPIGSLRKILSFLRVAPDEGRLQCLAKHVEGKVNRGQPVVPDELFTTKQEERIKDAVRRVSNLLQKRGLTPLPYLG